MKQVIAYMKPAVFQRVTEALGLIDGLSGMSTMQNNDFGRSKGAVANKQIESPINYFSRNVRLEILVSDNNRLGGCGHDSANGMCWREG